MDLNLNADFGQRIALDTAELVWQPSPLAGVERRMLDRIGGEVARATSIVRYAPQSHFSPHTHGGGEEFLVLEGTFSDEHGAYPAGMYVRNPPGSRHTPGSEPGCTILVKLWQMDPDDDHFVRQDTRDPAAYAPTGAPGESALELYERAPEKVCMLRWTADAELGRRDYPGGAELFVVEGSFRDENGGYGRHSWLRLPPGSHHAPEVNEDTLVLVKTGHLLDVRPPPPSS